MARGLTLLERELIAALKPFAEYAGSGKAPPSLVITNGSSLARQQLTMAHCYAARDALANVPAGRA
jgi:hypothetical protein